MASVTGPLEAPRRRILPLRWIRRNLFSSVANSVLTIVSVLLVYRLLSGLWTWATTEARWGVVSQNLKLFMVGRYPPEEVWRVAVSVLVISFLFGLSWGVWRGVVRSFAIALTAGFAALAVLPFGASTRLWLAGNAALIVGMALLVHLLPGRFWKRAVLIGWLLWFPASYFLLDGRVPIITLRPAPDLTPSGGIVLGVLAIVVAVVAVRLLGSRPGRGWKLAVVIGWLLAYALLFFVAFGRVSNVELLPTVSSTLWGGLLLTFLLTIVGIVASMPLGVLLALGRRSELPAVRWFSVGFIEVVRGVPLVTVLFFASLVLPLFLPKGMDLPLMWRVAVGIVLFSAAYNAENVRGGLQAIAPGQIEAAKALGMKSWTITSFIVLPQALRLVIPTTVGQFISLFKDTSLVSIVGLLDLMYIASKAVLAQAEWRGLQQEVFVFVAIIYFIFSFAMSYASQRLEVKLGVGER